MCTTIWYYRYICVLETQRLKGYEGCVEVILFWLVNWCGHLQRRPSKGWYILRKWNSDPIWGLRGHHEKIDPGRSEDHQPWSLQTKTIRAISKQYGNLKHQSGCSPKIRVPMCWHKWLCPSINPASNQCGHQTSMIFSGSVWYLYETRTEMVKRRYNTNHNGQSNVKTMKMKINNQTSNQHKNRNNMERLPSKHGISTNKTKYANIRTQRMSPTHAIPQTRAPGRNCF